MRKFHSMGQQQNVGLTSFDEIILAVQAFKLFMYSVSFM